MEPVQPSGDAPLDATADLAEFDRLRQEIDNRTQLATNLVLAELTALGAGLSFYDKVPDVLAGLAAISSFLWLLWLDHTIQIYKIASYIARRLAPRLRARYPGALGWEEYLRTLDAGGTGAMRLLFGAARPAFQVELPQTRSVGRYIRLLFGGTAPVLLMIYCVTSLGQPILLFLATLLGRAGGATHPDIEAILRVTGLGLATALWIYAQRSYRTFLQSLLIIDEALRNADMPAGEPPASSSGTNS